MAGALLLLVASPVSSAAPASVEQFSPQGTVKGVRQVTARFSAAMVPFGDLRDVAAPFAIDCPETGTDRWIDARTWSYDFTRDLPAGLRCAFTLRDGLHSLAGEAVGGRTRFEFSTGGPAIRSSQPAEGSEEIEEDQLFVLEVDGEPDRESVLAHAGFEIEGIAERVGADLVEGGERERLIASFPAWLRPDGPSVLLRARRTFPNKAKVRLVWGAGLAAPTGVATDADQVLDFTVRPVFGARLACERENAKADCIALAPIRLSFSAAVARERAGRIRLVGTDGKEHAPAPPDDDEAEDFVESIEFAPPFTESATYRLVVPPDLGDDAGRHLDSADVAALTVKTGPFPPLAKFAARFGILEANAEPALPLTIRNLDPEVKGRRLTVTEQPAGGWRGTLRDLYARLGGEVRRVPASRPEEILPWLRRLASARRGASIFAGVAPPPEQEITDFTLPPPDDARTTQVVGIPFSSPGFYLVELASPRLGAALLERSEPMYVPAAALVTNLAVHLQWAHDNGLVWVTTLDGGAPVANAAVTIRDCNGKVVGSGRTDTDGIARFAGLPAEEHTPYCSRDEDFSELDAHDYRDRAAAVPLSDLDGGLFVIAQTENDTSFVHSSWRQGVETWRFELPTGNWPAPVAAHTILDRPLFRAGETVHMKHVLRRQTMNGFAFAPAAEVPDQAIIRHLGSDETYTLPLAWDANGSAEQSWPIPPAAKLGSYDVSLKAGDRQWPSGGFRVEQFRLPLMRATVQLPATPQVGVTEVPVDLAVQYLAGGAAADLPVALRARVRDRLPPTHEDFEPADFANGPVAEGIVRSDESQSDGSDDSGGSGASAARARRRGELPRRDLRLDAAGTTRATIDAIPAVSTVRELLVEAEYRDPNGEVQSAAASVPLWPASLLPGIRVRNWAGTADSVEADVVVLDVAGKPKAGAEVRVDLFRRVVYSHRKRLIGGFYAYEHVEDTRRLADFCAGRTDGRGVLECRGAAPAAGELILQATVRDEAGREAAAHQSAYVGGKDDWGFEVESSDRIDVVPEKTRYEPGETARFQVRMPFREATALVAVEREGIGETRVLRLSATNAVIDVPVRGEYAPNVFVSVFLVRGRTGGVQPTATVDLGRPAFKLGVAEIRVGWRAHALAVEVAADRPAYRVRDTATVNVAVRSADGSALADGAEVAVAAVDEALLELMPNRSWNLLDAVMGRRGFDVRTATAQMQVVGKRHFGRKARPQGGGGGRQGTRELFDTLLLWKGRVGLDAGGRATVQVPLNDSLTAFRIVAVATAGADRFGTGSTTIRSTQDIMLLSGLPPLVRQGDELPAQFTLRNTTDRAATLDVSADVEGLVGALETQRVTLAAGESRLVAWPIRVPTTIDGLKYTVEARRADGGSAADSAADRLVVTQRVLPALPVRTRQATLLRWEPNLLLPVERPAGALPDRGGIGVAASASLVGSLAPLQAWLRDYPYTCLEQKVSIAVGRDDAARWQAIAAALPSYQDADGLLRFFPSMPSGSEVLTAYVLAVSHAANWPLPQAVEARMAGALRRFVAGDLARPSTLRAPDLVLRKLMAVEALARAGRAGPDLLDSLRIEPNLWPTSAVLDWWSILERLPDFPDRDAQLRNAEHIVLARLNLQGTTLGLSTEKTDRAYWLLCADTDVNAARLLLHAVEFGRWRDEVPRLARGLLGRQTRGRWTTTVADAFGALALRRFAAAYEAAPVSGTTTATLGDEVRRLDWAATPAAVNLPWPRQPANLRIDHAGSGLPWLTVSAHVAEPLAAPVSSGYRIARTVTPLQARTPGQFSVGDTVRVRLEVEAQSDMAWVVVDDPIPAGASHLATGLGRGADTAADGGAEPDDVSTPTFAERRFDGFRAYYEFVDKGRFVAEYAIRLNQSGRFALPPTRVEAMYAPEMFGEAPNAAIEVMP